MTRQDWFFLAAGPIAILLIWALLPGGRSEAWRAGSDSADSVAELVGYAFETRPAEENQHSRPVLVGRSAEAGFRLHSAPVAPRAAWLTPPGTSHGAWQVQPARAGLTLKLLEADDTPETRVRDTSVRPWRAQRSGLSRLALARRPRSEPIVIECGPPGEGIAGSPPGRHIATVTPVRLRPPEGRNARAGTWGARIDAGGDQRLILPWSESVAFAPFQGDSGPQGIWFRMSGPTPRSIEVGIAAEDPVAARDPLPICSLRSGGRNGGIEPARGTGAGATPAAIGALELRDGDLLAIGRTRFLVHTEGPSGRPSGSHRLELYHVRDPEAAGYFRASSGHDAYHPNRRALWAVPPCSETGETPAPETPAPETPAPVARQEMLTLVVEPEKTLSGVAASTAELPFSDRRRQREINAAIRDHGLPHKLPAVMPARDLERALLSLCTAHDADGGLSARLVASRRRRADAASLHKDANATPPATGISLWTDGSRLRASGATDGDGATDAQRTVRIGTPRWGTLGDPRELLADLEGNLLSISPAAGPRVTRRTRTGLAVYLIFILALQAWPLTRARIARRQVARHAARIRPSPWPAALAVPSLQQTAGIAIVSLLFLGASFHLFLGLHPELVGKPDYLQAFLQGTVTVCVVLAAAAGFSSVYVGAPAGRLPLAGLERRCAAAMAYAAAALLAAAAWWWLDSATSADAGSAPGAWLTAWRDLASAAAGASPEAMGRHLFSAGGLSASAAAVLFLTARWRWSRAAEHLGRFAVRVPLAGFLALAAAGLALGVIQRSALAFELALIAGLAWYAAIYWAFVRHGRVIQGDDLRRRAAATSMASGLLMLVFLTAFFIVGADLPDAVSFASVALGLAILVHALRIARDEKSTSLLRVVSLWLPASILGMAFASFVLTDMGSVAAWIPALLTGFFLWLVRPEEVENRREEPRKALSHLLLALGSGFVLLGLLDVFKRIVEGLDWRVLERPQQRLALAEDISYITSGEWITQVRWLASQQDDTLATAASSSLHWVPNANSDVAIFGLAANLGFGWAVAASLVLLAVAGCAALAADQALREAHAVAKGDGSDRLRPALFRALGLTLGMVCVLLLCQWLVHLATGVVLHLPITGLVFPWISHGNTTHLLYAAAILLPMAAINALASHGNRHR